MIGDSNFSLKEKEVKLVSSNKKINAPRVKTINYNFAEGEACTHQAVQRMWDENKLGEFDISILHAGESKTYSGDIQEMSE